MRKLHTNCAEIEDKLQSLRYKYASLLCDSLIALKEESPDLWEVFCVENRDSFDRLRKFLNAEEF